MKKGKIKATVIKCVSAVICCLLVVYGGISNTNKVCDSKLNISQGTASDGSSFDSLNEEINAQFADMEIEDDSEEEGSENTADEGTDPDSPSSNEDSGNSGSSSTDKGKGSSSSKTEKNAKKITLTDGLDSTKKAEVLEYYKLVSRKNANLQFTKTLTLVSMNGGKNISQRMIDVFTPIAKKALAKNTVTDEPYPGKPDQITASDWQAAKAVNDGTFTTVYVKVVPQTDGINGSEFEGTAGRSMGVLDGVQRALQDMPGVTIDFNRTNMEIEYINPVIKLKVKNSTGELVKGECEWSYRTHPIVHSMDGKVLAFNIHLEGAGGYIDYAVKY